MIESALIDVYCIDRQLTNKIRGFNSSEPTNAITLQRNLSTKEYVDSPSNPKYIIIKVKDYWLNQRKDRYECTRSAWKINPEKAKHYPYILSVIDGIVHEVYKVIEWHCCEDGAVEPNLQVFLPSRKCKKFLYQKKIPAKYRQKGQASPYLYCKPD